MTTSRLSDNAIEQLSPLLGSLARMVASGSKLSEPELEVLLMGSDLEGEDPTVLRELERWSRILIAFKEQPTAEIRHASVEALEQRGLKEAPVLLAVDLVANSAPTGKLKVRPDDLNFEFPAGEGVSAELLIEGRSAVRVRPSALHFFRFAGKKQDKKLHAQVLGTSVGLFPPWISQELLVFEQEVSSLNTPTMYPSPCRESMSAIQR